jgi:hypothetical protein
MSVGRSLFDHPGFRKLTTATGTTLPATIEDGRPHNATTRRALGKAMAPKVLDRTPKGLGSHFAQNHTWDHLARGFASGGVQKVP